MPEVKAPLPSSPPFVRQVQSADGSRQSLGLTSSGQVYSWGPKYSLGQLGRTVTSKNPRSIPSLVKFASDAPIRVACIYAGGFADAGHSAVLDDQGQLWMAGCDRWQQLGFGSPSAGAAGYTWLQNGRIYHFEFVKNRFVVPLLQSYDPQAQIRDVALGGDHSVVLSSNKRDVFTFGKGGEGQLGLSQKLFLSAPARSPRLSSSRDEIAAVCAIENCSLSLDSNGKPLKTSGKCRQTEQFLKALRGCQQRAADLGLLTGNS